MLRLTIASPPDREKLVAEIFLGAEQVAEQSAALDLMGRGMADPSNAAAEALTVFLGRTSEGGPAERRKRGRPAGF